MTRCDADGVATARSSSAATVMQTQTVLFPLDRD